jgi:hypothetical protein
VKRVEDPKSKRMSPLDEENVEWENPSSAKGKRESIEAHLEDSNSTS